jgi:hypothetical protein
MHHATNFVNAPCADAGFAKQLVGTHPKRTKPMVLHPLWDRAPPRPSHIQEMANILLAERGTTPI